MEEHQKIETIFYALRLWPQAWAGFVLRRIYNSKTLQQSSPTGSPMSKALKPKSPVISKSKLMLGIQFKKLLWPTLNMPKTSAETSDSTQMQFNEGNEVEDLARKLAGKGYLIYSEYWVFVAASKKTQYLINNGSKLIFEATFVKYFKAAILKKTKSDWYIVEVKKSTLVKDEYIKDCAIQRIVMKAARIITGFFGKFDKKIKTVEGLSFRNVLRVL
jgi:hypothetical protein